MTSMYMMILDNDDIISSNIHVDNNIKVDDDVISNDIDVDDHNDNDDAVSNGIDVDDD